MTRILLISADQSLASEAVAELRPLGIRVDHVTAGSAGADALREPAHPNLVLIDLGVATPDIKSFLNAVRAHPTAMDIPIMSIDGADSCCVHLVAVIFSRPVEWRRIAQLLARPAEIT